MTKKMEIPEWLTPDVPAPVGRRRGSGPTQQLIVKVFDKAAEYGVTEMWPSQVHKGAKVLFGYSGTRDVIQECMKKLVRHGFLRPSPNGYLLAKRPDPPLTNFPTRPIDWHRGRD